MVSKPWAQCREMYYRKSLVIENLQRMMSHSLNPIANNSMALDVDRRTPCGDAVALEIQI